MYKQLPAFFKTYAEDTAFVLAIGIICWATGFPIALITAQAAQVSNFSDTISTSEPGVVANHTVVFTTPTGVPADGSTIVVSMPSGFDVSTIVEDDVDIADDGVELTTGASCGAVQAAVTVSSQDISIEVCNAGGGAIAAASVVTVKVGTNATNSGTGSHRITNHATPGSYVVSVGGTMDDLGDTRIAIVEGVTVSANIDTIFSFSVNGKNAGLTVNDDVTPTSGTSTATTVPFGTLSPNTPKLMAQELRVNTNALNGFSVTVQASQTLTSQNGSTIDEFTDGTAVSSSTLWTVPSGTMGNADTYGHWGITSDDNVISGATPGLWGAGEAAYRGDFVSAPVEVFYHTGPVLQTSGVGVGSTTVAYKIETTNLQEAANDYTANLTYIATPVF